MFRVPHDPSFSWFWYWLTLLCLVYGRPHLPTEWIVVPGLDLLLKGYLFKLHKDRKLFKLDFWFVKSTGPLVTVVDLCLENHKTSKSMFKQFHTVADFHVLALFKVALSCAVSRIYSTWLGEAADTSFPTHTPCGGHRRPTFCLASHSCHGNASYCRMNMCALSSLCVLMCLCACVYVLLTLPVCDVVVHSLVLTFIRCGDKSQRLGQNL